MATWVNTLPTDFLKDSLREDFADNLVTSPMDYGPPKVRARGSAAVETFSGNMYFTTAQVATLYTFYHTTLNHGADSFDSFTHPRTGSTSDDWMFSPGKIPTFTRQGLGYIGNISLDRLP